MVDLNLTHPSGSVWYWNAARIVKGQRVEAIDIVLGFLSDVQMPSGCISTFVFLSALIEGSLITETKCMPGGNM
jgi:hypothetical protein